MSATTKTDHSLERMVFFSDAVFAIAITLLIIEVRVPELPRDSADALYWRALSELIPSFAGYLISFSVIGIFWASHHRTFALADRFDQKILSWNMCLLGVIAFMPFTTAFLTHNMAQRVPSLVYCVVLLVAGLLNVVIVRIATGPAMVKEGADPQAISYVRGRSLSLALGALTAIAVSYFEPRYGQMSLVSIGIWRRIITRRLR